MRRPILFHLSYLARSGAVSGFALSRWLLLAASIAAGCAEDDGPDVAVPNGVFAADSGATMNGPMPGLGMMPGFGGPDASRPDAAGASFADAGRADAGDAAPIGGGAHDAGSEADAGGNAGAGIDAGPLTADAGVDAGPGEAGTSSADASAAGMNATSVCMGGKVGKDSDSSNTTPLFGSRNFAYVIHSVNAPNRIVSFRTTLVAPELPTAPGTLFIWPGLQNRGGNDPARIGNGVLQPVLTYGPSCLSQVSTSSGWKIAGMYVNISSGAAGPTGCAGGDGMDVPVGDRLFIDMSLDGTLWTQTITNLTSKKTVDFSIDLKGQDQHWAIWDVEVPSQVRPAADTIFEDSVVTYAEPVTSCQPGIAATADYFSAPVLSPDGLHCCFDKVILKKDRN